jgi:hypothetical protein
MPLRPLEKQFEPSKVTEIRKLAHEFDQLRRSMKGDSTGYMISGIHRCLETGILLGALSISLSLLDMFVHDMAVHHEKERNREDGHKREPLPQLETGRQGLPFEKYIHEFMQNKRIDPEDGKALLETYKKIGIPLHHILSRPIGPFSKKMILGETGLLDRFLTRSFGDVHQIEGMIEDHATETLKVIVSFLRKYQDQGSEMSLQHARTRRIGQPEFDA